MRQVDEARAQVKERQKIEERAALRVRQAQAEVNMADQEKDTVSSELDQLDDKMDKENGEISKVLLIFQSVWFYFLPFLGSSECRNAG